MLKKSEKFVALTSTSIMAILVCSFSNPAVAQRVCIKTDGGKVVCNQLVVCVKTDAGKVVCGELVQDANNRNAPKPNSSISLEGKYSLSWVEEVNTACLKTEALADLKISPDGLMQGTTTIGGYQFNGKVNADGTWSAELNTGGYRFNGTISNGKILGTYTAQPAAAYANQTQCQGKVTGFKKPN
ncbi:hypothetical protein NIES22_14540 [Calothrix brevissima NIES-22]|nr:hypothetical protein NIES22_14540 [Calothrix brevissima NIES-22]